MDSLFIYLFTIPGESIIDVELYAASSISRLSIRDPWIRRTHTNLIPRFFWLFNDNASKSATGGIPISIKIHLSYIASFRIVNIFSFSFLV